MKVKTEDLEGEALDWAVAQCEMRREDYRESGLLVHRIGAQEPMPAYSSDWAFGGPVIDREQISLFAPELPLTETWRAGWGPVWAFGPSALIAAMRVYVRSKLGDEVDIPDQRLSLT